MGRADDVLSGLALLRDEDVLCDVELQADGRTSGHPISAHRAVLAAASPYFKAMFSGRSTEFIWILIKLLLHCEQKRTG